MLIENPLNESPLSFPVLEYIHIAGFVIGVGTISLLNFRLLGAGLTRKSTAQLWRDTMPWTLGGLSLVIFSGLLLFSLNPDVYYLNYTFLAKMSLLVLAILFYYLIVRKAAAKDMPGIGGKTAACISLTLWTLVICGGIFIGLSKARPPVSGAPPAGVNFDDFLQPTPTGGGAAPNAPAQKK